MKVNSFILAQKIILDQRSKNVSAIDIFEDPILNGVPSITNLQLYISILNTTSVSSPETTKNSADNSIKLLLSVALNEIPIINDSTVVLTSEHDNSLYKVIIGLGSFPIQNVGELAFNLKNPVDNKVIHEHRVQIRVKPSTDAVA